MAIYDGNSTGNQSVSTNNSGVDDSFDFDELDVDTNVDVDDGFSDDDWFEDENNGGKEKTESSDSPNEDAVSIFESCVGNIFNSNNIKTGCYMFASESKECACVGDRVVIFKNVEVFTESLTQRRVEGTITSISNEGVALDSGEFILFNNIDDFVTKQRSKSSIVFEK